MTQIIHHLQSLFVSVGPFFILLGLLIFVHELGHFLVAKYYGVRVETFSLGFGKKILSFKRGDTVYCLSIIPLGGYVKMYGDDPSKEIPESERPFSFLHKPLGQRVAVVLAGPLMNLFFAALLYVLIAGVGEEVPAPVVGDIPSQTAAFDAGFRSGDRIIKVAGREVSTWKQARDFIADSPGKVLDFVVERGGEAQPMSFSASVGLGPNENIFSRQREIGTIGGLKQDSRSTVIGVRDPNSIAAKFGLSTFDMITSINGQKVEYWRDLNPLLKKAIESGTLSIGLRPVEDDHSGSTIMAESITVDHPELKNADDLTAALGIEPAELFIFQIKKDSPADKAGVQKGDRVVKINGEEILDWNHVLTTVKSYDGSNEGMEFGLLRNGEIVSLAVKPQMTELMTMNGQEEKRFTIGIVSGFFPAPPPTVFYRAASVAEMLKVGLKDTLQWSEFVVMSLVRLVQGEVSAKNVGGVITIGRVASHSFAAGLSAFLKTMAIISINLFILNLLPIPVLDGGHLVFYAIEGLKGAPLSMRKMELAQQVGLMLLMMLMVFALFNDITNLFNL